ncbi:flagellar hook-associated family protein [Xanthobacter agilis]|uniref:Flagellin n=1 Tax=Xanthobacter agilis TaxID=47492 RepID=A0ABU0LHR7_XANAG|nr:flagellar hook-associated family protein [Xanthobacter agilis]MDQ0506682.1 flagellar hook-associated protein 3 FlgL [Xanthobacter agilis]
MKSGFISTLNWTTSSLKSMSRLQTEIATTTAEISSGRQADVGLTLGVRTGQSVSLYATKASIDAQTQSNAFASNILSTSQTALSQVLTSANDFLSSLITGSSSSSDPETLVSEADGALSTLIDNLNTADGQRYVFGGTNSSVAPMVAYEDGPETAVIDAFTTAFGVDPSDSSVSAISADDMSDFLDGAFADLFSDPGWGNTWSNASDQALTSQVSSSSSRLEISTTANTSGMRNLTMALTMVAKLGTANLSAETRAVVIDKATQLAGASVAQITTASANLGVTQTRIDSANSVLSSAGSLVDTQITNLEGVDTAEAKTKLDNLTTQLQMSYSTTATLMQLSLLDYA